MRINQEGYGIIRNSGIATAVVIAAAAIFASRGAIPYWLGGLIALAALALFIFTIMFFRQPSRPLLSDPDIIFAPADGKVVVVEETFEGECIREKRLQVSVFMSITNVHCNLYPISGRITYFNYHPGRFLVAWHPKSSDHNERTTTVIDTGFCTILMRQIAGLVARRIVSYPEVGAYAVQNHKMGFIKFGSRVDLMLPLDAQMLVGIGDKVKGGITPIARLRRADKQA